MASPYLGFLGKVWDQFPQLAEWHDEDPAMLQLWSMDKFIEAGYHNFHAERKQLLHISKLIEKHAQDNAQPLLATFEKIARYKFVEKRYQKLIEQIPKIWVIADYDRQRLELLQKST